MSFTIEIANSEMLNRVLSYPTSIFIDKTGKVRKIHTGFNGPATGDKYIEFTTEFERGRLSDLVSLLSGRNFETRKFE